MNDHLIKPGTEDQFLHEMEKAYHGDAEARHNTMQVMDHYMNQAPKKAMMKAKSMRQQAAHMKAFGVSTDFPDLVTDSASFWQEVADMDLGFMEAFQEVPPVSGHGFFEIATARGTGAFVYMPEGSEVNISKYSGDDMQVPYITVAYGIGWTLQMIQDKRIAIMFDRARNARNLYWKDKRDRHLLLLTTACPSGNKVAYDSTGANTLEMDINTINNLYTTVMASLLGLGIIDSLATPEMLLFTRPTMLPRINRAIRQATQYLQTAQIEFPVRVIPTWSDQIPRATGNDARLLAVVPGAKLQTSVKMEPTVFQAADIKSMSYIETVWSRYGAGVGEPKQIGIADMS